MIVITMLSIDFFLRCSSNAWKISFGMHSIRLWHLLCPGIKSYRCITISGASQNIFKAAYKYICCLGYVWSLRKNNTKIVIYILHIPFLLWSWCLIYLDVWLICQIHPCQPYLQVYNHIENLQSNHSTITKIIHLKNQRTLLKTRIQSNRTPAIQVSNNP